MTISLIMLPTERKHGTQSQDVCIRGRQAKKFKQTKNKKTKKKLPLQYAERMYYLI